MKPGLRDFLATQTHRDTKNSEFDIPHGVRFDKLRKTAQFLDSTLLYKGPGICKHIMTTGL